VASLSAVLRVAVCGSIAILVTGCSLSVLEGLSGGGKADSGSTDGSEVPRDADHEIAVTDVPDVATEAAPDRLPDTSAGTEASLDAGTDANSDGEDDPDDSVADGDFDGEVSDGANDASEPADRDATMEDVDRDGDGRILCVCPGDAYCAGGECVYTSCLARLSAISTAPSGVTWIDPDGEGDAGEGPFRVYCEMVADGGGWTLVLKVDGTQTTFLNHSPWWENNANYRPEYPDLDVNEAKLASYGSVAFANVRVGMLQSGIARWLVVPEGAASFRELMQGGYRATTLGRAAWKSLPASGSLQTFCGREGFNVTTPAFAAVRIGIIGNEYDNCTSCDSWIGFGGELMGLGYACGNVARWQADNGDRDHPLFGYVMVR
jgi:Fibrinogen beta and gamma chains, C-terminal globular domain